MLDFVTFITFHNKCISLCSICQEIFPYISVFFYMQTTTRHRRLFYVNFYGAICVFVFLHRRLFYHVSCVTVQLLKINNCTVFSCHKQRRLAIIYGVHSIFLLCTVILQISFYFLQCKDLYLLFTP